MTLSPQAFPQADPDRAARVFAGELLVYRQVPALDGLRDLAVRWIEAAFEPHDPPRAHEVVAPADYQERVAKLHRVWRHCPAVREAWRAVFLAVGLDLAGCFCDSFHLRVLPPRGPHVGRATPELPAHRDTWSSNLYQQMNWWTPLYPITEERGLRVYPAYWDRAIANASADWDLAVRRGLSPEARKAYPKLPRLLEQPEAEAARPVVIAPGDLLCFSAQHLHGGQPNDSAVARFSLECRSVNLADVRQGRAAPNSDGAAPRVAWHWFKRFDDGLPLDEALNS
jgi:hypothetical protein